MRLKQSIIAVMALVTLAVVSNANAEDRKVWASKEAFVTSTLEETKKLFMFITQNDEAFSTYGQHLSDIGHVQGCTENQEFFLIRFIDRLFVEIRPVGSPNTGFGFSALFNLKKGDK